LQVCDLLFRFREQLAMSSGLAFVIRRLGLQAAYLEHARIVGSDERHQRPSD